LSESAIEASLLVVIVPSPHAHPAARGAHKSGLDTLGVLVDGRGSDGPAYPVAMGDMKTEETYSYEEDDEGLA
jgi:hypothetical protein